MRNFISLLLILLGVFVICLSSSNEITEEIAAKRSQWNGSFGIHRSDAGDLVSMSYLDNVKQFWETFDYTFTRPTDTAQNRNVDLYVFGDSYLEHVPDTSFGSINAYHYARRSYSDLIYNLDPHKRNVLVFEYAERFARGDFNPSYLYEHVKKAQPASTLLLSANPVDKTAGLGLPAMKFFDKNVTRNLEFNIFGYRFWDNFKLTKASLNYHLFKRATGDAVVSRDGSRIFLRQTMLPNSILSSYTPFTQEQWQRLINDVDTIYEHYKAEGFDEIYLAIIPNPVTILQPDNCYNEMIPKLQAPGAVNGMKFIDVYGPYSSDSNPGRFYRVGDTHWSNNGIQVWLETVNKELKRQSELADSTRR